MITLGISAFYHNSSCCLFKDGKLLYALQEERLSRLKSDASFPIQSIRLILQILNLSIRDIDLICYYEDPKLKLERQFHQLGEDWDALGKAKMKSHLPEKSIRENLNYQGEVFYSHHHLSHLGNGIFQSGWEEASFLTVDGVGEWNTLTWGHYVNNEIKTLGHIDFPHSLGILYSTITSYLGFDVNDEEFKVMGLSAFGRPLYKNLLKEKLLNGHGLNFKLNLDYFSFPTQNTEFMFNDRLEEVLGVAKRSRHDPILECHQNLARSLQELLEEELIQIIQEAFPMGCSKLILSGGVAYNSLANKRISDLENIQDVFIPVAANDTGSSIGACVMGHLTKKNELLLGNRELPYWGDDIGAPDLRGDLGKYFKPVNQQKLVECLMVGKVIAVCRGRWEFGDRALGNRSIIAHPDFPHIKNILNSKVKRREEFRPFAPLVIQEKAREFFQMTEDNSLMSKVYTLKDQYHEKLKGIQSIDHSARVQTLVREDNSFMYDLLQAFELQSGFPILVNTSFNLNGEPMVASTQDALNTFLKTNIDILVLGEDMLFKDDIPIEYLNLYRLVVRDNKHINHQSAYDFI